MSCQGPINEVAIINGEENEHEGSFAARNDLTASCQNAEQGR